MAEFDDAKTPCRWCGMPRDAHWMQRGGIVPAEGKCTGFATDKSHSIACGAWRIYLAEDRDGHLTVELQHKDGSTVCEVDEDFLDADGVLTNRFTTEKIEEEVTKDA